MLAIDDELAEVRKAISWKPWQHDEPYADRKEIVKECVDVLHFVANILCAAGATDGLGRTAGEMPPLWRKLPPPLECPVIFFSIYYYFKA
jgi:hypothetical protein